MQLNYNVSKYYGFDRRMKLRGSVLMRILIAEDEKSLNRIIAKQLKASGYSVDCAFNGEEAYDLISVTDYDAAVFDDLNTGAFSQRMG